MPDISLPLANFLSNLGNLALILGAVLVLVGTWLTVWTGGQKERYADERIAVNEEKTASANAIAAQAVERTEQIKNENLKLATDLEREHSARIKIEQGLASRRVTGTKRATLVEELRRVPVKRVFIRRLVGETETKKFGEELDAAFKEAGIQLVGETYGIAPGFPDGLTIVTNGTPESEAIALAFRRANIEFATRSGQIDNESAAMVLLGLKPPSF